MKAIAAEFRRRGKPVIIGGPYASLSPDTVRPHCDVLIRGETEEIAPKIFADLDEGCWAGEYVGTRPDLRTSPVPPASISTPAALYVRPFAMGDELLLGLRYRILARRRTPPLFTAVVTRNFVFA